MPDTSRLNVGRHITLKFEEDQSVLSKPLSLRGMLEQPSRFSDFCHTFENTLFDFSKHLITVETIAALAQWAREVGLEQKRNDMFAGVAINESENRAVLHTLLRAPESDSHLNVNGEDASAFVHDVLKRMRKTADAVISGIYKGHTGKAITDIVNIGIGGSDLGPRFVVDALRADRNHLNIHFVSNVDGEAISSLLPKLNAETTLFIVASKTFTTEETMLNAAVAKDWMVGGLGLSSISKHFMALSTNVAAVEAFGINVENCFPFRDWVGGRYSLWSAIGFSIMLAIGPQNFDAMLAGAHAMDRHFAEAPLEKNIPFLMGAIGVWYRNFWGYSAHLLLPYDERLAKLPKFIQQMDMESNGKSVDRHGNDVAYKTGPIIFGEPGTDSQHSFMQLIHQGTDVIPADFIICKKPRHDLKDNHEVLMANFLAQSRALAVGQTLEEAKGDPQRVFSGNRPSTSIILDELTPYSLGLLMAAYEHKVFVQGVMWNLNSFDQPGVELGKVIAKEIRQLLKPDADISAMDSSTQGIIQHLNHK